MRKYLEFVKINFENYMTYKLEFFLGIVSVVVNMFVLYFLWSAIYSYNNATVIGGLTLPQMITYFCISLIISRLLESGSDHEIQHEVRYGVLTTILTKPIKYQLYHTSSAAGFFLTSLLTIAIPGFVISFLIFKISIPSLFVFLAFVLSIFFSFILNFSLLFITGLISFWTVGSIWGFRKFRRLISNLMSGSFIPLYFFPPLLAKIAYLLPFQAIYNVPLSIYIGKFTGSQIVNGLLQQLIWSIVLIGIGFFMWRCARKRFTSQGG